MRRGFYLEFVREPIGAALEHRTDEASDQSGRDSFAREILVEFARDPFVEEHRLLRADAIRDLEM